MSRISRSLSLIALVGVAGAQAGNGLGLDSGVGLLSFDNARLSNGGISGNVLVGGDATISGMSIQGRGGNSLLVGGDLNFGNGSIGGNSIVGGQLASSWGGSFSGNLAVGGGLDASNGLSVTGSTTAWGSITGVPDWNHSVTPGSGAFALGFDFGAEQSRLTNLSARLDDQAATGAVKSQKDGLVLNARGETLAVFDIDAADAAKDMHLVGLEDGASVVINVHGSNVDFGSHGYKSFREGQVLFNLVDAQSVSFSGGVTASFLAPQATVTAGSGEINGQLVVDSFDGNSLRINSVSFDGALPPAPAVPEPGTGLMMLAGIGAAALLARRRLGKTSLRLVPGLRGK